MFVYFFLDLAMLCLLFIVFVRFCYALFDFSYVLLCFCCISFVFLSRCYVLLCFARFFLLLATLFYALGPGNLPQWSTGTLTVLSSSNALGDILGPFKGVNLGTRKS